MEFTCFPWLSPDSFVCDPSLKPPAPPPPPPSCVAVDDDTVDVGVVDFDIENRSVLVRLVRLCEVIVAVELEFVVIVEFDSFDIVFCMFCTFWILFKFGWQFWCCVTDVNLKIYPMEWVTKTFAWNESEKSMVYRAVAVVDVADEVVVWWFFILLSVSFNINCFENEGKKIVFLGKFIDWRALRRCISPIISRDWKKSTYICFLTWQFQTLHCDWTDWNNTNCVILVVIQIHGPSSMWPGFEFI